MVRIDRKLVLELDKAEFGELVKERGERRKRRGDGEGIEHGLAKRAKMALILYIKERVSSDVPTNAFKKVEW